MNRGDEEIDLEARDWFTLILGYEDPTVTELKEWIVGWGNSSGG